MLPSALLKQLVVEFVQMQPRRCDVLGQQVSEMRVRITPRNKPDEAVPPDRFFLGPSVTFWKLLEPDLVRRRDVEKMLDEKFNLMLAGPKE